MKTALCVLVFLLFCSTAAAQEPTPMPTGSTCTVNGVQLKAYTLDEYKIVAGIYVDYVKFFRENVLLNERLQLHLQMEENYKDQLTNAENLIAQYKADHEYWTARLKDVQEANKKVALSNNLEKIGLWVIVGVETVLLGAFAIRGTITN